MSTFWAPAPPPATRLARHRVLGPRAGVHVSPLQLGAMSIGDQWAQFGFGSMDKAGSFALLDAFYGAGGNFIDTANNYQDESSEEFLGEWMEARGVRGEIVLATKYSSDYRRGKGGQHSCFIGNSAKSLYNSVEDSLRKLRSAYIDILYVHWWDYTASVEEVMDALHALVLQRKVLYLGVSDTPAWVVVKANQYARYNGKTPFAVYQGKWSILDRDFERELLPMCISEGLAIAPWNVLGGGRLRTDAEEEARAASGEAGRTIVGDWRRTPGERAVCGVLEAVARELGGAPLTAVAIAWVLQKAPHVFPLVGGRKVAHLRANVGALALRLSDEQVARLDAAVPLDKGFPYNRFGDGSDYYIQYKVAGHFDKWPKTVGAIKPEPDASDASDASA
ncbi:aryl-alcohol dehydrogenase-like protein [Phanerochaete sordida]|uniref:Aryl-alcohol dehydrogenase-like protein n=1 Tax=Phanerochaete sordida TaxID=48140 RepID=A0A9P3LEB8_9APHY|nr:aryl-alcohol dehydrogenase-like protein [Phanerochaete sordida]